MKKIIMSLLLMCVLTAWGAPPIKTVTGEYTYYGDGTTSPADCKRNALEGARLDALAKEFGTIVTQDVMQADRIDSNGETNKFLSLSSTGVKGEWIADDGEPQYDVTLDNEGNMVVHCKVKGKAREISNESVDFEAYVLRNAPLRQAASTDFYNGDKLYMYFCPSEDGYVSVFLSLEGGKVYQMLPYLNGNSGEAKVKKGYDYVFFDVTKAEGDFGDIDPFVITCPDAIEFNKIYVVYSPSYFARPIMKMGDQRLYEMSEEDFTKWLVKTRRNDPRLNVKQMNLKIYPR